MARGLRLGLGLEQSDSPVSVTKSRLNALLSERLISLNSGGNSMSGIEPASDELTWKGVWCEVSKSISKHVRPRKEKVSELV